GPAAGPNSIQSLIWGQANGTLYFALFQSSATPGGPGTYQLWKSDGTPDGTGKFADLPSSANNLREYGSQLYFNVAETLWISDGTADGTRPIKQFGPGLATVAQFRDDIFFAADDGEHGRELWKTDGTEAGTKMVTDLNPKTLDSNPTNFATIGGT